jgi:hypothetical protein
MRHRDVHRDFRTKAGLAHRPGGSVALRKSRSFREFSIGLIHEKRPHARIDAADLLDGYLRR